MNTRTLAARILFAPVVLSLMACAPDEPDVAAQRAAVTSVSPVLTQHNDNARTGAKLDETALSPATVQPGAFGKLFTRVADGQIYTQPLWVPNLDLPGAGTHDVVFVATEQNSVYAFDATDPAASQPLWHIQVGTPPTSDELSCGNVSPVVGITSTPVIDLPSGTLYFVAKTKRDGGYFFDLHAVDLRTGAERTGSPLVIAGSVPGSGAGGSNGVVSFQAFYEHQRSALLLSGGNLYIAFGSHCDNPPYFGWVFAYDASTLAQVGVYNDSPDLNEAGIWTSGQGPAADDSGVYFMTGNGGFTTDGRNLGDSFVKLDRSTALLDWFTPHDAEQLAADDTDLGSTSPVLLPGTNLLAGVGKAGVMYLLDRANLGHFTSDDRGAVQTFYVGGQFIFGSPVYWNGRLYVGPSQSPVRAFAFNGSTFDPNQAAQSTASAPWKGSVLSLSADGSTPGSGIVWSISSFQDNAFDAPVPAVLRALDARDLTELWNSKMAAGDDVGSFAKFCPPTIANGRVYVATMDGTLQVYGLSSAPPPPPDGGADLPPPDLSPPSDGGTEVVFSDRFDRQIAPDDGLGDAWTIVSGFWYADGAAITDAGDGNQAAASGPACLDCTVRASLIGFGAAETGLYLRAPTVGSADRYDVVLLGDGRLQIRRVRGGVATVLSEGPSGIADLGSPAVVTLSAVGLNPVTLNATVDGVVRVFTKDRTDQRLEAAGWSGLWSSSAGVVFRDFTLAKWK